MRMKVDYLIVGGGLAGVNFAMQCMTRNRSFLIMDDTRPGSSRAAAGLINPITGRNYVRSWNIDTLIQKVVQYYSQLEEILGETFLLDLDIRRVLNNIQEENKWYSRGSDPLYNDYVDAHWSGNASEFGLRGDEKLVKILGAYRLRIGPLLSAFQSYLESQNRWESCEFRFEQLDVANKKYQSIQFGQIVFCKGAYQQDQPFDFLPIKSNLGEVLMIHIPTEHCFDYAIKKKVFICPFDSGMYWVGGTYTNVESYESAVPDYDRLKAMLSDTLALPYEVKNCMYGVRATVPDRKPLVGIHPEYSWMTFLNGLGTKGSSLAPFCAESLFFHIEDHKPLPEGIDLKRYLKA